jgi:hypothetical protein
MGELQSTNCTNNKKTGNYFPATIWVTDAMTYAEIPSTLNFSIPAGA